MKKIGVTKKNNGKLSKLEPDLESINHLMQYCQNYYKSLFQDKFLDLTIDTANMAHFNINIILQNKIENDPSLMCQEFELGMITMYRLNHINLNFNYTVLEGDNICH